MSGTLRDRAHLTTVLTGALLILGALTACDSGSTSGTGDPAEPVEGACVSSDECLLLPPPSDCDGDWFCEEWRCEHHCTFKSCETASDCTISEICQDGQCVPDKDEETPPVICMETGCSSEICAAEPMSSTCEDRVEFECLVLTTCGTFGPGGTCGWEQNQAYLDCLTALEPPADPCAEVECEQGETCVDGVCKPLDPCDGVQCGEDQTCVDGSCVPVEGPECETEADCAEGQSCVDGACTDGGGETDKCYVSGCSGEICSPEFTVSSDCAWLPEFDCLLYTLCGPYGEDGQCGWEQNAEYLACLENLKPPVEDCNSNEDCAPEEICLEGVCASKPPLPPGMCTSSADCKAGAQCIDGFCVGGPGGACQVTGCSGEICAPMETMSDCTWLPEYECLQYTTCGQLGLNGICGWAKTPEYVECLLGIDGPASGLCKSDTDCIKPGSKCNAEDVCLPPPDGGPEEVCWGECVPKEEGDLCGGPGDCPTGFACECVGPGGFVPPNAFVPPCVNQCVPKDEPPGEDGFCQGDADCEDPWTKCNAGEACLPPPDGSPSDVCWGECVPKETGDPCQKDGDCPGDLLCACGGFEAPNAFVPCVLECTEPDLPPQGQLCTFDEDCPPGQLCDPNGPSPWAIPPPPDGGAPPPPMPSGTCTNPCITTGCSGIICAEEPVDSTCGWEPSYACYAEDTCGAFGPQGSCQWQGSEAFQQCMESFNEQ